MALRFATSSSITTCVNPWRWQRPWVHRLHDSFWAKASANRKAEVGAPSRERYRRGEASWTRLKHILSPGDHALVGGRGGTCCNWSSSDCDWGRDGASRKHKCHGTVVESRRASGSADARNGPLLDPEFIGSVARRLARCPRQSPRFWPRSRYRPAARRSARALLTGLSR